jgi:RHS repeat-associated protein
MLKGLVSVVLLIGALGAVAQDTPEFEVSDGSPQRPPVTIASDAIRGFGAYAYDGSGNITSVGDGTGADTFVYDRLGRLEGATLRGEPCSNMPAAPCRTEKYTYDRFGNIVSIATAGNPSNTVFTNADDDTNHITGAGVVYDSRGNLTAYQSRQFAYDGLDMMTSSDIDGLRRIYVYSATDERVVTVGKVGSTFTGSDWTIRDAGGRVLRRLARSASGTFTWTEDSIYRGGQLLSAAVPGPEKVRNFHLDHLGTPRLITGNGGAQIAEHHYRPYGPETPSSTWDDEKAKFTGHERDAGTLDYMHARYYDPYMGRFLSVDPKQRRTPLSNPQMWNRYAYALNNPLNFVDLDGEDVTPIRVLMSGGKAKIGYVDSRMVPRLQTLVTTAHKQGVSFTFSSLLRTQDEQDAVKTTNTKNKKGTSPHTAGVAVDINVSSSLKGTDLAGLTTIARGADLSPLNKQADDRPHLQANDLITRGDDGKVDDQFKALVEENQQQVRDYEKLRKEDRDKFEKDVVDIIPPRP